MAEIRLSGGLHIDTLPEKLRVNFYPPTAETPYHPDGYGSVDLGPLNVFLVRRQDAEAIAAAFTDLAAQMPEPEPVKDAGPCRICGAQTRYVDNFSGGRTLIHADAGIRFRDHHAELVPDAPGTDPWDAE